MPPPFASCFARRRNARSLPGISAKRRSCLHVAPSRPAPCQPRQSARPAGIRQMAMLAAQSEHNHRAPNRSLPLLRTGPAPAGRPAPVAPRPPRPPPPAPAAPRSLHPGPRIQRDPGQQRADRAQAMIIWRRPVVSKSTRRADQQRSSATIAVTHRQRNCAPHRGEPPQGRPSARRHERTPDPGHRQPADGRGAGGHPPGHRAKLYRRNERSACPVKTEEDPLDSRPVPSSARTAAAIRHVEKTVPLAAYRAALRQLLFAGLSCFYSRDFRAHLEPVLVSAPAEFPLVLGWSAG